MIDLLISVLWMVVLALGIFVLLLVSLCIASFFADLITGYYYDYKWYRDRDRERKWMEKERLKEESG